MLEIEGYAFPFGLCFSKQITLKIMLEYIVSMPIGKKMYARRVIMQTLRSIRLAEVDNFFKQRFEQKKN